MQISKPLAGEEFRLPGHVVSGIEVLGHAAHQAHLGIVDEGVKQANGIGSSAHTSHQNIGQPPQSLQTLGASLLTDHGLKGAINGQSR